MIIVILSILDLILTLYFVHYIKAATEVNPLLLTPFSLILAKVLFISIYLYIKHKKLPEKQKTGVRWVIGSVYIIALSLSVYSALS